MRSEEGPIVYKGVIVEEQPASNVEGYEHIDGIVLVGGQDEEHPEAVADPCERVQEVYTP